MWKDLLSPQDWQIGLDLAAKASAERKEGKNIYPPQDQIFRALYLTPPDKVKVCIVGQDPYHIKDAANGLAFSVNNGTQPSLTNIFKELVSDIGCAKPVTGDLTKWAENGVLLLNTTLTVYEGQPNSHSTWGWNKFTGAILRAAHNLPRPTIFLLFGANAQDFADKLITTPAVYEDGKHIIREKMINKAYVLSSHPSPFSVTKPCRGTPPFRGSKPFSTANHLLISMGETPIDWTI